MSHGTKAHNPVYGLVAEFDHPETLLAASAKVYEAGYRKIEAYSPFPVHGLSESIGFNDATVRWIMLGGGIAGLLTGLALEGWSSVQAYPHNVGGRPLFSWPSFIPVIFECTILFSAISGVLAVIALSGLPRPHHPIFGAKRFDRATQDLFFLCVESGDPKFDPKETRKFLESLDATSVSEVENDED